VVTVTVIALVLIAFFAQRKRAEEALRESERRFARRSAALGRLHEVGSRLWFQRGLRQALDEILAGAIELLGADMGTIRILDTTQGVLKIAAHQGFKRGCLNLFRQIPAVGNSACERVLRSGERMVIEDVETDKLFTPFRPFARAAGYRAIQLAPIMDREGMPLGMLATHFRSVHKPAEQDLRLLDLYVRQAADFIERHRSEDALRESEERLRLAQLRTGIGIWDWNLRTGKLTWTPQLEALFGLEPGSVNCYADFRDRVYVDDLAGVEAKRDAAVRRHETFNFEFRIVRPDGQVRWVSSEGGAFYDEVSGEPSRILGNATDITERKELEEHNNSLIFEFDHHVNNVLSIIAMVASSTRETSSSSAEFVTTLDGRIKAMATTHELLRYCQWQGVPLGELVRRELAPYATAGNTWIEGPDVVLRAEAGQTLAMVFHELATNAARFGAISASAGRVSVHWSLMRNGHAESWLDIQWEESGGPRVVPPTRSGFGYCVVRELIPYELGGSVDLRHPPEGVCAKLQIPATWLSARTPTGKLTTNDVRRPSS
jgi:PAS domain S-box-containing protein